MYDIRLLSADSLQAEILADYVPHRIILSRGHEDLDSLVHQVKERWPNICVKVLKASTYKGVLRNVPLRNGEGENTGDFVSVAFRDTGNTASTKGPVLVLWGLKYKGNVGSIIRTAVQSNMWEGICLIDECESPAEKSSDSGDSHGVSRPNITEDDMEYYSLCNAPLIHIERFSCQEEFLNFAAQTERKIVGVDGGSEVYGNPQSLLNSSSWKLMKRTDLFVVLGSESHGLSSAFLDVCDHLVTLPCLSASINVSACFAAVDTIMKVSRQLS